MTQTVGISGYVCPNCNWSDVFQAHLCPRCHGPVSKKLFTPQGSIATFTVIRYPPQGFEKESPYVVALIDIENGLRVIGRVAGKPENVQIGKLVHLVRRRNGLIEFELLD